MQLIARRPQRAGKETDFPSFRPGDALRVHVKLLRTREKKFSFSKVL